MHGAVHVQCAHGSPDARGVRKIQHIRQKGRNREPPLLRTERIKPDRLAHSLPREGDRGPVELDGAAVCDLPHGPGLEITDLMPHRRSPMG